MGLSGQRRIAQRYPVVTTPIRWKVARRRRNPARAKVELAEAAVVEVSVMGAAIVAPVRWEAFVGNRVEVQWEGLVGSVIVRRAAPYPGRPDLVLYGVEWADNPSVLGKALFESFIPVSR